MDISVILCTYNRSNSLQQTLQTLCGLSVPAGVEWELLIVDNNSSDDTRQVVNELSARLPVRYLFEPRQGKSHALNLGITAAGGNLLLFTDDDVDVDPGWLASMYAEARNHQEASFFGGRTLPRWECSPPRWMAQHSRDLLQCVSLWDDRGDDGCLLLPYELVFGCNMAIRRELFDGNRRFDVRLGPRPGSEDRGEETALIEAMAEAGHRGFYVPDAVIYHRNPRSRMTEKHVRKFFKAIGAVEARRGLIPGTNPWFGAPRFYWRRLALHALLYGASRWTSPSRVWIQAEINMSKAWGVICEFRRRSGDSAC